MDRATTRQRRRVGSDGLAAVLRLQFSVLRCFFTAHHRQLPSLPSDGSTPSPTPFPPEVLRIAFFPANARLWPWPQSLLRSTCLYRRRSTLPPTCRHQCPCRSRSNLCRHVRRP